MTRKGLIRYKTNQPITLASNVDRSKKNGIALKKNSAETMTDADYADDLALLANTYAQAESLLLRLEQAARGNSRYAKANKTEYMYFKREGAMSTLNDWPLKLFVKLK